MANFASSRLRGRDLDLIAPKALSELRSALEEADLVHLHCIHSYFVGTRTLLTEIAKFQVPTVWTLHDSWTLTGRCAIPGPRADCEEWRSGCRHCPHLGAYPAAIRQTTSGEFVRRRRLIRRLQDAVPTTIIPCASWLGEHAMASGLKNVRVIHNSVDPEFWSALSAPHLQKRMPECGRVRVVMVARDLSDRGKVNRDIVAAVGMDPRVDLLLVGNHVPHELHHLSHRPAIETRADLADVLTRADRMLYTSSVDYFPLTIAEGLAAGLEVFAVDSPASREFAHFDAMRSFQDVSGLLDAIAAPRRLERPVAPPELDPSRMTAAYFEVYQELLAHEARQ